MKTPKTKKKKVRREKKRSLTAPAEKIFGLGVCGCLGGDSKKKGKKMSRGEQGKKKGPALQLLRSYEKFLRGRVKSRGGEREGKRVPSDRASSDD